MSLSIRPARRDERAALVELQRRASLANPGDRQAPLDNPDAVDTPEDQFVAGNVLVAGENGRVLGFAAIFLRDNGDAELDGLFVEPQAWKEGIGSALVAAAAERARRLGAQVLHVIGNPHAEGFYVRTGFRKTGTFETRFGPGLLMQLPL